MRIRHLLKILAELIFVPHSAHSQPCNISTGSKKVRKYSGRLLKASETLKVVKDLQNSGDGPGLSLAAEGTVLTVFIRQLWQTPPRGPENTT